MMDSESKHAYNLLLQQEQSKNQQLFNDIEQRIKQELQKYNLSEELKNEILQSDCTNLKKLLEKKTVTSEQIVLILYERTLSLKAYNFITQINYEVTIQRAQECDNVRKNNPEQAKGYFFGIPFSVKDLIDVQDYYTSCGGLLYRVQGEKKKHDGFCIKLMRNQGGIPFLKSNAPQCGFLWETKNFLYGSAKNPYNNLRSVGGSSGGEGGLLATSCSPLGIGSDMGGSLRLPAHFCGVICFKPSTFRISSKGHAEYRPQSNILQDQVGVMAKSIEDINLFMKCMLDQENVQQSKYDSYSGDPYFNPIGWNQNIIFQPEKKIKKIGYFLSCERWPTCNSIQSVVKEVIQKLQIKYGYSPEQFEALNLEDFKYEEIRKFHNKAYYNEGLEAGMQKEFLERKEAPIPEMDFLKQKLKQKQISSQEYFKEVNDWQKLKLDLIKTLKNKEIEAIIMPIWPNPAFRQESYKKIAYFNEQFLFLANHLAFPAGVVPIRLTKDKEDDTVNEQCHNQEYIQKHKNDNEQDLKNGDGLPIGVQVMGLPFEDEKCVRLMKEINDIFKFTPQLHFTP